VFAVNFEPECNYSIRERVLKAFLDLVIIRLLSQHSMSGYEINKAITKQTGIMLNPSTIYSKLYTLEKQGQACYVMVRSGKIYSLTPQGHQTMKKMPVILVEICETTKNLLINQKTVDKRKRMTLTEEQLEQHILRLQKDEFSISQT
jgi:DNA-binding PadR family transcriptional regulator